MDEDSNLCPNNQGHLLKPQEYFIAQDNAIPLGNRSLMLIHEQLSILTFASFIPTLSLFTAIGIVTIIRFNAE